MSKVSLLSLKQRKYSLVLALALKDRDIRPKPMISFMKEFSTGRVKQKKLVNSKTNTGKCAFYLIAYPTGSALSFFRSSSRTSGGVSSDLQLCFLFRHFCLLLHCEVQCILIHQVLSLHADSVLQENSETIIISRSSGYK